MGVDARHLARERALELLYEAELKGAAPTEVLASLPVAPDPLVVTLVRDAAATREVPRVDAHVRRASSTRRSSCPP